MSYSAPLPAPTDLCVGLSPTLLIHDPQRLTFSWQLPYEGYQKAYRLTVTAGTDGGFVYDSHWVESGQNVAVIPDGLSACLCPDHLYEWRVALRVSPPDGDTVAETPCSLPSRFVTSPVIHRAVGLWADEGLFAFLRREFSMTAQEISQASCAVLTVTAASPEPARQYVYHAYVNGRTVGIGPSRTEKAPDGQTILYHQSFDITALLKTGLNCLGAICYTAEEKAFYCRLAIYDHSGEPTVLLSTDEPSLWQALSGDTVYRPEQSMGSHCFVAHACNVDGSRYPHGFAEPGFDGSAWSSPSVHGDLCERYRLLPSTTAPLCEYPETDPALKVTLTDSSSYLVDLGREIVGGFSMTLPVDAPADVTLVYGEELTPDGHVLAPMRTGNHYREHWRFVPGEKPLSTLCLMTYRYVEILHSPVPVTPSMVQGIQRRAAFDETDASLTCDHSLLARLWTLVKHTVKVTTQDLYVDSQSRERLAYEGDLLINLMAAHACGGDPSVGRFTTQYLCAHRTWPAEYPLFVIMASLADYMITGDVSFLKAYAPMLERMVYTDYLNPEVGLIASPDIRSSHMNSVLVDWPITERDGYHMEAPFNTVFNALCARAYGDLAKIFRTLGDNGKADTYNRLSEGIQKTMITRLYDPADGGFFDGCDEHSTSSHKSQHATAFCLACGIFDHPAMEQAMAAHLAAQGEIRMSVYGAYFLLEGLYRTGHGHIANRLMLSEDASEGARTWAYMIDTLGATVTAEAWNRTNKPNMTFSHPWGAAPASMIATGIFGILPTAPGYERFDIRPCIPEGITQAAFTMTTAHGKITVAYDAKAGAYSFTVPFNTTATLYLPGEGSARLLKAGKHVIGV